MIKNLSNKKVYVTGADGFIGSHLVEELVKNGAQVKSLVYYNSWNEIGWLKDIKKEILSDIEIIKGDIRDSDLIRRSIKGSDIVFHLASLIAIPYSYDAPRSYVDTNVNGALNVLEACKDLDSLERILHVSTSETYGSAQYVPIDEKHPLVGQSPYSASKIAADKMAESYHLSFGLPIVTARPFNTYGPRQTARAVIPTIAAQLVSGASKINLGDLSPTRDFNYVTDTALGMISLACCEKAEGEVVNIGSGTEWSIEETFKKLCKISGKEVEIVFDKERARPKKSEVNRLLACNKKISRLTEWSPRYTFEEGLKETYKWIDENISLFNSANYSK